MKQFYFGPLWGLPARAAGCCAWGVARAGVAGLLLLPWAAQAQGPAGAVPPGATARPAAAPAPGPRVANVLPPNPYGRAALTTRVVAKGRANELPPTVTAAGLRQLHAGQ